jgi:hypothetical protein
LVGVLNQRCSVSDFIFSPISNYIALDRIGQTRIAATHHAGTLMIKYEKAPALGRAFTRQRQVLVA